MKIAAFSKTYDGRTVRDFPGMEPEPGKIGYYYYDGHQAFCSGIEKQPRSCHGTGDLFAAVIAGAVMRGQTPAEGGNLAMELISASIAATPEDSRWGVHFEPFLARSPGGHLEPAAFCRSTDE